MSGGSPAGAGPSGEHGSGAARRRDAAAHLVVGDVTAPALDADQDHHVRRVLRLRDGDEVTVTDGAGRWRPCVLRVGDRSAALEAADEVVELARPGPEITVAFALTKRTKPEWCVQKLTELGVDRIVPFRADRSVVRWDAERARAQVERWRAVSLSAVEQARLLQVPLIEEVAEVPTLATLGAHRVDFGGAAPSLAHSVVAVGPEGGWTDAERALLPEAVGLGPSVLRAETATITIGALLGSLRSGLVAANVPDVDGA